MLSDDIAISWLGNETVLGNLYTSVVLLDPATMLFRVNMMFEVLIDIYPKDYLFPWRLNPFVLRILSFLIVGSGDGIYVALGICDPPKKNSGALLDICLRLVPIGVNITGL
jgi:hypothetical protein